NPEITRVKLGNLSQRCAYLAALFCIRHPARGNQQGQVLQPVFALYPAKPVAITAQTETAGLLKSLAMVFLKLFPEPVHAMVINAVPVAGMDAVGGIAEIPPAATHGLT